MIYLLIGALALYILIAKAPEEALQIAIASSWVFAAIAAACSVLAALTGTHLSIYSTVVRAVATA